jgi:SET domain
MLSACALVAPLYQPEDILYFSPFTATNFNNSLVCVSLSGKRGRGIFAVSDTAANSLLCSSPCLEIPQSEIVVLWDINPGSYIFQHPLHEDMGMLAFGLTSIVNHSATPNCRVGWRHDPQIGWILDIISLVDMTAGTELTFDYEGVWFDEE